MPRLLISSLQWLGIALGVLATQASAASIEFNCDIRPILSDKCFACHGPDSASREADLRLDLEDQAKLDRGGYAAIVPGKLDESALIQRITSEDESERMPPAESHKTLSAQEIELLKKWVSEGATWQLNWAYLTPERAAVPVVRDASWPRNWIDNFVLARLEAENLKPAAEAGRRTMIRRLYVDLIGLPPTPAEYDEIIADKSPDAYERLVDRLLSSPHFGERMAMYWLDLVRFADTVGYHGDQEHHISPYRDYVINAFNANMPFDRFTREQLAGDLLPRRNDRTEDCQRLQPVAPNVARRGRAAEGVHGDLLRRPCAKYIGSVDGGHDGVRPVPRPQVRSIHDARLLFDGCVLRGCRRE